MLSGAKNEKHVRRRRKVLQADILFLSYVLGSQSPA